MKRISLLFVPILAFGLYMVSAQNNEVVVIDNEFVDPGFALPSEVHCNPLLLNGKPLDYHTFDLNTSGELTLVVGNPPEQVPFHVQLRPQISQVPQLNFLNHSVYSVEVSKVLANAKGGDLLIITPTSPLDWRAKRILMIKDPDC